MGIRFFCPNGHKLNVKAFLAGQRAICPDCDVKFIVPMESGGTVVAVDENEPPPPPSPMAEVKMPAESGAGLATDVWHVRTGSGEQHGPATTSLLKSWIGEGKVDRDSWVWRTGWLDWQRASEVFPELGAVLGTVAAPRANPFTEELLAVDARGIDPQGAAVEESAAVNAHRRMQRKKREQLRTLSLFLGGMILLLALVLVGVLLS